MKRSIIALFLVCTLLMSFGAFAESDAVRVAALKGPTAMGMVRMMETETEAYAFSLFAAPDELVPQLAQGAVDIAAVPANLASILYKNTNGGVRVLAINTLGVLYIVERGESIQSVEDLRGRTIYSAGKGSTPEFALNYILRGYGLEPEKDVTVEYKSEHAECVAALLNDDSAVALLPQPFVTVAQGKAPDLRIAIDLTDAWDAIQTEEAPSSLITGVVVARTAFVEAHPESVAAFMEKYAASIAYVNENTEAAAELIGSFDIVPAAVAEKALPFCNIVCIAGEEMQQKLSGYLAALFAQEPASVGGVLPDEAFYYLG